MKFIKTKRGYWINPAYIKYFSITDDGEAWVIFRNFYRDDGTMYDSDRILIGEFDSYKEANTYIDKLVAKLNSEETQNVED